MADSTSTAASGAMTVAELQDMIKKINGYQNGDELHPNIYVADVHFIKNKETLKTLGITHVLNSVEGNRAFNVDAGEAFYTEVGISYMGIPAPTTTVFPMAEYLRPAADFIHKALQDGGKVAVTDFLGVSSAVTLVIAYVMLYESLPLVDSFKAVGGNRRIYPFDSMVQDLIDLDGQLSPTRKTKDAAEPASTEPITVKEIQALVWKLNRCEHFNEVYPNVCIGDKTFIQDKETLKAQGITHVLNAAEGSTPYQVNTNQAFYSGTGISYMGVPAPDKPDFKMADHFRPAADFIHKALQDGGKVAVNCYGGASRSSTLVLSYLLLHKSLPLVDALRTLGANRQVNPNKGFLQQLIDFENELKTTKSS